MNHVKPCDRLWSIILAGGEGERVRPFVQRWLGRPQPKQYCWSDWGRPEQIANTLRRIGRQPAFPLACLDRPFAPTGLTVGEGCAMAGL